tara:strand:+ start:888 stop:1379 length:492 start_codon:yes stop_codon:yes gene_type:complete
MASTRYNYDNCRTEKHLQEATDPGRYMLNTPGNGIFLPFINDPQIRLQHWGANLMNVQNGHPVDIDSDLIGLTNNLSKYDKNQKFPLNKNINNRLIKNKFPIMNKTFVDESRSTHPAWMYRDLEQNHRHPLHLDPQENLFMRFQNNLSTRILDRDYYDSVNSN